MPPRARRLPGRRGRSRRGDTGLQRGRGNRSTSLMPMGGSPWRRHAVHEAPTEPRSPFRGRPWSSALRVAWRARHRPPTRQFRSPRHWPEGGVDIEYRLGVRLIAACGPNQTRLQGNTLHEGLFRRLAGPSTGQCKKRRPEATRDGREKRVIRKISVAGLQCLKFWRPSRAAAGHGGFIPTGRSSHPFLFSLASRHVLQVRFGFSHERGAVMGWMKDETGLEKRAANSGR